MMQLKNLAWTHLDATVEDPVAEVPAVMNTVVLIPAVRDHSVVCLLLLWLQFVKPPCFESAMLVG